MPPPAGPAPGCVMLAAMFRGRPFIVLCLLIALLPLRGWAAQVMHLPARDTADVAAHCHDGTAIGPAAADAVATAAGEAGACVLCDLCHGAAMPAGPAAAGAAELPVQPVPDTATPPPPAGAPEPLFRPPRG